MHIAYNKSFANKLSSSESHSSYHVTMISEKCLSLSLSVSVYLSVRPSVCLSLSSSTENLKGGHL